MRLDGAGAGRCAPGAAAQGAVGRAAAVGAGRRGRTRTARHRARAAGEVVPGGVEQRAEQRRPHHRLLLGERVGDRDRPRARVAGGDPQPPGLAGVGEAPADDLVEAEVAQRVLGPAPQPLLAGRAADLPRARAGSVVGRCSSKPWIAADLLDQVDLAGDVVVAVAAP